MDNNLPSNSNNDQNTNQPNLTPQLDQTPQQSFQPNNPIIISNNSTKKNRKIKIIILVIVLVILIISALVYVYLLKNNNLSPVISSSNSSNLYSNTSANVGQVKFLSQSKLIAYQPIYKNACKTMPKNNTFPACNIFYFYQVGMTTGNNNPIIVAVDFNSQMAGSGNGYFYAVFIKESSTRYELIKQYNLKNYPNYSMLSGNSNSATPQNALTAYVKVNLNSPISNSFNFPSNVTLTNNVTLTKDDSVVGGNWFIKSLAGILIGFGDSSPINTSHLNLIGQNGSYMYFDYANNLISSLNDNAIFGTLQNDFAGFYQLNQPISNNSIPAITWNGGQINNNKYIDTFSSCSLNGKGYITATGLNNNNLTVVGKLNGQNIYQLPISNQIFQAYYNTNFPSVATPYSHSATKLSSQQYSNQHGVILLKNSLNQYVVYQLSNFAAGSAC